MVFLTVSPQGSSPTPFLEYVFGGKEEEEDFGECRWNLHPCLRTRLGVRVPPASVAGAVAQTVGVRDVSPILSPDFLKG
jgi:hypothetical protein